VGGIGRKEDGVNDLLAKAGDALRDFGPAAAFYALAAVILGTAAYAVWTKKIVHSAFALMGCFFAVAGIYALLGSDFLAVTQVVVYVGGIMVLIVFGVLLTDRLHLEYRQISRDTLLHGALVALPVLAGALWAVLGTMWPGSPPAGAPETTTAGIGTLLLTDYLFPFEFASLLLLLALVGAARLARGDRTS
jgi:NADH:ubiquinone oxidoreductase subunit 6 (subunit J)